MIKSAWLKDNLKPEYIRVYVHDTITIVWCGQIQDIRLKMIVNERLSSSHLQKHPVFGARIQLFQCHGLTYSYQYLSLLPSSLSSQLRPHVTGIKHEYGDAYFGRLQWMMHRYHLLVSGQ